MSFGDVVVVQSACPQDSQEVGSLSLSRQDLRMYIRGIYIQNGIFSVSPKIVAKQTQKGTAHK